MANFQDLTKVKADLITVTIDGDTGPFEATVEFEFGHEAFDVAALNNGQVRGRFVDKAVLKGKFTWNQMHETLFRKLAEMAAAAPRTNKAAGSQMATHTILFHHPDDTNADLDVYGYAVVFGMPRRVPVDGKGPMQWECAFEGLADSSDRVWRVGDGV